MEGRGQLHTVGYLGRVIQTPQTRSRKRPETFCRDPMFPWRETVEVGKKIRGSRYDRETEQPVIRNDNELGEPKFKPTRLEPLEGVAMARRSQEYNHAFILEVCFRTMQQLKAYKIDPNAAELVPANARRQWMDDTDQRYAYRCLPLSIANAMGWTLLLPRALTVTWNGGAGKEDITIEPADDAAADPISQGARAASTSSRHENEEQPPLTKMASSHFGHGVLTFHPGYLFRTEPEIGLWARGAPNLALDGISPLEGIIETDWLSFPFTMNWRFTRPGSVFFERGFPFCFVTPIAYRALLDVTPEILPIEDAPELQADFEAWRTARQEFNDRLLAEEPDAVKQAWQKWYTQGEDATGTRAAVNHLSRLRLRTPQKLR